MELKKSFPADPQKVKNGVPFKKDGATFILSFSGATISRSILNGRTQQYAAVLPDGEALTRAMHDTLVETVVLGWEGLTEDGEEVVYSKEKLYSLLKEYVGFDMNLMEMASDIENFLREQEEKTEKNC